jgi:photosystem II stability/assembly factor-like uncharacterized protein
MWSIAGLLSPLQDVPIMFAQNGVAWIFARCGQGELVAVEHIADEFEDDGADQGGY